MKKIVCDEPSLLVTPKQAAQRLSLSERTLWELTQNGEITCVRIGRAVRYAIADLHKFVDDRRAGAAK